MIESDNYVISGPLVKSLTAVCTICNQHDDSDEYCNLCGGCEFCCTSEEHCPQCGMSDTACGCQ
jgi:hypothetical protein